MVIVANMQTSFSLNATNKQFSIHNNSYFLPPNDQTTKIAALTEQVVAVRCLLFCFFFIIFSKKYTFIYPVRSSIFPWQTLLASLFPVKCKWLCYDERGAGAELYVFISFSWTKITEKGPPPSTMLAHDEQTGKVFYGVVKCSLQLSRANFQDIIGCSYFSSLQEK